jgi:hypothetical protein
MAGSPAQQRVSSERETRAGEDAWCDHEPRTARMLVANVGVERKVSGAPAGCAARVRHVPARRVRVRCRDWRGRCAGRCVGSEGLPDTCRRAASAGNVTPGLPRGLPDALLQLFSVRSCRARATAHLHTRTCTRAPAHTRAVTRGCPIGHGGAIGPPGGLGQLTHSFTGRLREIDKIHNARRCTTRQAAFCHDNLLVAQRVSRIEITVHRMVRRVMRRMMRHASVPVTRGCAPRVPVSCSRHGHRPRACASGVVKPRSAPPRRPGYDSIRFPHTFAGALP